MVCLARLVAGHGILREGFDFRGLVNRQRLILALAVLVAVVGYGLLRRLRLPPVAQTSSVSDPNAFMPDMAAKAVAFAADRGVTLDYSPSSVKAVESLLGQLHDDRMKGRLSDQDLNAQAMHFGGYIGEVLHRKYGGTWSRDHKVAGPSSFPFHWNACDSFPVGWCGKRILNGDEDNVWFKFQVVTSKEYQSGAMMKPRGAPATNPE